MALQNSMFWRRWLPVLLLLVVVLVLTAFNRVGQPLRVTSGNGPWGLDDGMLALQLAGRPSVVQEITADWGPQQRLRAGFLLGLDGTDSLKSATLWGEETRQITLSRDSSP